MHTKLFATAALTFACLNVQAADMPVHLPAVSDTMRGKTFTITPTHIRRLDQLEELAMDLGTYRQKLNLCKSHELRDFDKLLRQVDEKLERADFNNGFLVKVYRSRFKQGEERSLVYAALLHPDFRSGYCRGIGGFVSGTAENKKELTQRTYKVITQVENAFNVDTRETQINTGY